MPGLSVHIVDVASGVMAAGMAVEIASIAPDGTATRLAGGRIGSTGTLADEALNQRLAPGRYRVILQVAAYYRDQGGALPAHPFLDAVVYDFGIDDPAQHYHLPFKLTPWGYSCFRGGA